VRLPTRETSKSRIRCPLSLLPEIANLALKGWKEGTWRDVHLSIYPLFGGLNSSGLSLGSYGKGIISPGNLNGWEGYGKHMPEILEFIEQIET
jgi:hypothetical protein